MRATASVLSRYRGALVDLLERGVVFVREAESAALADLAFVAILRIHDELVHTEVTVEDEPQPLVDPHQLLEQKIALLDAYLRQRDGRDPSCLATARAHIGLCLRAREQLSPLAWETLERIAHQSAADLLSDNPLAERAAQDAAVELGDLELLLRPYAERADWGGYVVFAEGELDYVDCGANPFPWVSGAGWFSTRPTSPVWSIVGYGAVAGFQERTPYGVFARNTKGQPAPAAHAVVVDPARECIHEGYKRASDGQWMMCTYSPVTQGRVEKTGSMGPDSLQPDVDRSPYLELERAPHAPQLIALLEAVGAKATAGAS